MADHFFDRPILNSPYLIPSRHWELDAEGQPTNGVIETRRRSDLITPVPKPKKRRQIAAISLAGLRRRRRPLDQGAGIQPDPDHQRNPDLRRNLAQPAEPRPVARHAGDRPAPQTLAQPRLSGPQAFFCQIEAVETAIWLTEVAPKLGARGANFWDHIRDAQRGSESRASSPRPEACDRRRQDDGHGDDHRLADRSTRPAIRAARHFSRGFLIVAPGITIVTVCACCSPTTPTATTAIARSSPRTCSAISIRPRSSSRTTTPSSCASGWRSPRARAARSRVGAAKSYRRSKPKARCSSASCPSLWA